MNQETCEATVLSCVLSSCHPDWDPRLPRLYRLHLLFPFHSEVSITMYEICKECQLLFSLSVVFSLYDHEIINNRIFGFRKL